MNKMLLAASIFYCSLAITVGISEANQQIPYSFTWKNMNPLTICGPLEIDILNNGAVVYQKFSGAPLKYQSPFKMDLFAAYCTKIQLKALCSGNNIFQEIGCTGGTIEITSPTSMTFYK